jgi:hypothetical protein
VQKLIAGALIGAGLGLGLGFAAPAQAAPSCSFNNQTDKSSGSHGTICGAPNLKQSINDSVANLKKNLSVGDGLKNLQHNLTHGVGSDDAS